MLRDPSNADELLAALADADLVVLAGYLRLVPAAVVARFRNRTINIHPALLPRFGGAGMYGRRVHEAVLASGATESGATVHYVNEQYDRGPIIAQRTVPVLADDTVDALARRVLVAEHELLPQVVLDLATRLLKEREETMKKEAVEKAAVDKAAGGRRSPSPPWCCS